MGNTPNYYLKDGIECQVVIDVITSDCIGAESFYIGNIIKYLWRYKNKNCIDDLRKAQTYVENLIGYITRRGEKTG